MSVATTFGKCELKTVGGTMVELLRVGEAFQAHDWPAVDAGGSLSPDISAPPWEDDQFGPAARWLCSVYGHEYRARSCCLITGIPFVPTSGLNKLTFSDTSYSVLPASCLTLVSTDLAGLGVWYFVPPSPREPPWSPLTIPSSLWTTWSTCSR